MFFLANFCAFIKKFFWHMPIFLFPICFLLIIIIYNYNLFVYLFIYKNK